MSQCQDPEDQKLIRKKSMRPRTSYEQLQVTIRGSRHESHNYGQHEKAIFKQKMKVWRKGNSYTVMVIMDAFIKCR